MPVSSMLMSSMMSGAMQGGGGGAGQGLANLGGGLLSGVVGFFQRRKAKKALANLHRPEYNIPNEILQNQKRAEMAANEGLPSQQYNQAMQNIQLNQNRALTAAGGRRSALMALPGIQQQSNDQVLNLDMKDAQARMANQQQLYGINSQVAGYKDKQWDINKMQPYQRDYNYNMNLLASGNQNLLAGADKIMGGAGLLIDGGVGRGGRGGRKMSASDTGGDPAYYNGYGSGSDYSDFQTGF